LVEYINFETIYRELASYRQVIYKELAMKRITSILTFIVTTMLFVSACAQQQPDQAAQATPVVSTVIAGNSGTTTPYPPANTPTQPAPGEQKIVTLADQGKTITLAIGESFLLKLGEEYNWEVTISDQSILSRAKNIMVIRGAQGVYDALQAGTVTLTATGDPLCRQSKPPCGMPSILFKITVIVQ
jgi:hypothetical protein